MATTTARSTRLSVKNILFTTDFSAASEAALPYALAFARWYGAKVFVAHAIPPEPQLSVPLEVLSREDDPYWSAARSKLDKFVARNPFGSTPHEVLMLQGEMWHVLSNIIERQDVDFLTLGTHGRHGLKKIVLGSAAEQIFRLAPCPVLTVGPKAARPEVEFGNFKRILFATDFSPASLNALPYALSIAEENQAELTLLHLISLVPMQHQEAVASHAKKRLEQLLPPDAGLWCQPNIIVLLEFATDGILRIAAQTQADLIVMGVHKSAAARAVSHVPWAIAYDVVCDSHCPVLTVRG
jgi:nucleotide-binding universal stress UspA family protein